MNTILDSTQENNIKYFDGSTDLSHKDVLSVSRNLTDICYPNGNEEQKGVCILVDRCSSYIATILAAWKAGLFVVPLNTASPIQKNIEIINKIKPAVVIVDDINEASFDFPTVTKSELFSEQTSKNELTNFRPLRPSDIAYVIFTSGSTGEPKGVVISCESFKSYIDWTARNFSEYSDLKRLLLTSELTFDITMGDIAFALAFGTDIGVAIQNRNIPSILALIMRFEIDILYSVPTTHLTLASFSQQKRGADLSSLRLILSGGDRFPWQLVRDYKKLAPKAAFYNVYGPTEVTINCFSVRLDNRLELSVERASVPIGYCFDSLDHVLLDENSQPATKGELCVTGPQMMLGYHGDAELSESVFVTDTRIECITRKLYRTGDIGYYDNGLVYLEGRVDGLIKIRGYRIHPDEVSKTLDSIEEVDVSAVVNFGKQSDAALKAFIKLKHGSGLTVEDIEKFLREKLPDYMIPVQYELVKDFPLSQSGKIDKNSLAKRL